MFFGQNRQKSVSTETLATLMDASVKIEGDFYFDKSARIDGEIKGNIKGPKTKSSVLIVGPKAKIEGDILCHSVVVLGTIIGNIESEHLEVRSGATIKGDVKYSVIEVHQGSNINGRMIFFNSSTTDFAQPKPNNLLSKNNSEPNTLQAKKIVKK
jgi:cytoskeletal protein CcmA (bactofilin family)